MDILKDFSSNNVMKCSFSEYLILVLVIILLTFLIVFIVNLLVRRKVKKAIFEINKQQSYFYKLFMTIPAGIVILDKDYRIIDINNEFQEMFHYNLDEIKGLDIDELLVSKDQLESAKSVTRDAFKGERGMLEASRKTKNNNNLDVQVIASPIIINKEFIGAIGIYIDRTEQKKLEDEVKKAKNIESLGLLAREITHDFNNILAGILLNISLAKKLTKDEKASKALAGAEKASFKAKGLVNRLLNLPKEKASEKIKSKDETVSR